MNTFDQTKLLLETSTLDEGESVFLVYPDADPVLSVEPAVGEPVALANRVVACVNACHGLDLPDDLPPGILADVVTAAAAELSNRGDNDAIYPHPFGPLLAKLGTVSPPESESREGPTELEAAYDKVSDLLEDENRCNGQFSEAVTELLTVMQNQGIVRTR